MTKIVTVIMFACAYEDGTLVGVDDASGGYPYRPMDYHPLSTYGVRFWGQESAAQDYARHFNKPNPTTGAPLRVVPVVIKWEVNW